MNVLTALNPEAIAAELDYRRGMLAVSRPRRSRRRRRAAR
jgi:hypothetical protein